MGTSETNPFNQLKIFPKTSQMLMFLSRHIKKKKLRQPEALEALYPPPPPLKPLPVKEQREGGFQQVIQY